MGNITLDAELMNQKKSTCFINHYTPDFFQKKTISNNIEKSFFHHVVSIQIELI